MKLKSFLRCISAVLLLSLLLNSYIIPVSSEETIVVGQSTIHNGGFEYPNLKDVDTNNTGWKSIAFDDAAYDTNQLSWKTTATDKNLEYAWLKNTSSLADMSPHMKPTTTQEIIDGVGASNGVQFAEVVANELSSLYQVLTVKSGENYSWTIHHRGRMGTDTLAFIITDEDASVNYVKPSKNEQDRFQQIINWLKNTEKVTAPAAGDIAEYTVYTTKLKDSNTFETASGSSFFSKTKDSKHTVCFKIYLMSSKKADWSEYTSEYTGKYYADANKNIMFVLTPFSTSFKNTSGNNDFSGGNLIDNISFTDKKGQNLLINAGFDDVAITSGGYKTFQSANNATSPTAGIGWCTTATDYGVEVGNIKNADSYNLGVKFETVIKNKPTIREGNQFVELNANQESSLYQIVSTDPGKMYRWGLSHRGRSGVDTMALIIGPNQEYEPKKTSLTARDQLMQMVDWLYSQTDVALDVPETGCSNEIKLYTSKFNDSGGFVYSGDAISWQSDDNHTEEWSIWIISSLNDDWHDYGYIQNDATYNYNYIVPQGQEKTVFGFVSVNAVNSSGTTNKTYGNMLDNINFKEFYYVNADFNKTPTEEYGKVYIIPEVDDTFEPDDATIDTGWVLAGSNITVYYQLGERDFIGGYINGVFYPNDNPSKDPNAENCNWKFDETKQAYYYTIDDVNSSITVSIIYQAHNVIYDSCNQYEYQYNGEGTGYEVPLSDSFTEYISHAPQFDDGWKFMGWKYILTHEADIKTYMFDAVHKVEYYKEVNEENTSKFLKISKYLSDGVTTQTVVDRIPESDGITFFAQWKYRQRAVSKTFNETSSAYEVSAEGGTVEVELLYTDDPNPESATVYKLSEEGAPVGQQLNAASGDTYIGVTAKNKENYKFSGWYDTDGNLVTRNPSYSYKVKDGGVTELYAYFDLKGFDITVNTNVVGDPEDEGRYFAINCAFENLRANNIYSISGLPKNVNITVNGETVVNPTNIKADASGKANITLYMKHGQSAKLMNLPSGTVYSVTADNSTKSSFSVRGEATARTLSESDPKTVDLYFYRVNQFVSLDVGKHYEGILSKQSPIEITITEKSSYTLDVETKYTPSIYTGLNASLNFYKTDGTPKAFFTGTEILMIDLSDSNHPKYYSYTVTADNITAVDLKQFTTLGSTNTNFRLKTGGMLTEKLVFIVDYAGTSGANSGKISLEYGDDDDDFKTVKAPVKKGVIIGDDTAALTAVAVGNTSNSGPFVIDITVNESSPAVNTTYEGYQDSKYAVKLSVKDGSLPNGSYAVVGGNKYYSNNGYIKISPLEAGNFNVSVYSPVPLEGVDNKITFEATLLSAVSVSGSVPIEKTVTPIEFNCVDVAIDADVTDKVLEPGNIESLGVTLKHKGIDKVKLTVTKKSDGETVISDSDNVSVTLINNKTDYVITFENGFTAKRGETYIFSFVGYLGNIAVCSDNCCVVGGYVG